MGERVMYGGRSGSGEEVEGRGREEGGGGDVRERRGREVGRGEGEGGYLD